MGGGKGGGGGPTHSTSTVTNSNLPEYAKPYFTRLMARAETESHQPYALYPGQRIEGFGADTLGAFQGTRDLAAMGNPTVDGAANLAATAGQQALNAGLYTPLYANTGAWPGANAQQYMDPYIQNVLDITKRRATDRFWEQQGQRDTAASRAGAFGGSRQGIMNFLAQRDMNQQLNDIDMQGMSQAYQNAQNMWTSDQARALQAALANQQTDLGAAQLGLQGAQTANSAAATLGQLGGTQQQLTLDRIKALMGIGQAQQDLSQRGLDVAYNDFINQRDFERQNIAYLGGILHGVPVSPQSEVITTSPGPNPLSQLLGTGIAGAQLANMVG